MNRIAASYVFPLGGSEPIRNGYIEYADDGTVVSVGACENPGGESEFLDGEAIAELNVFVEYTKADSSDETSAEKIEELKVSYTSFTNNEWTHILNLAGDDYKDGLYKVTFTATDAAGKTSSVVRTVYKDTQIPEFGNSTITDKNDSGYKAENVKPYITTPSVSGWALMVKSGSR